MKLVRAIASVAAAMVATLAAPAPAQADIAPPRPFSADSGDACLYGYTRGSLLWITPGPLPAISVVVSGSVVDRPTPADSRACRDDGYFSTARFTAYSGGAVLGSQEIRADNSEVQFRFSLGPNRPDTRVTHLVVQVCRDPLLTLPPSYCGRAVTYSPTSIGPTP
jgi:hypothetical protein